MLSSSTLQITNPPKKKKNTEFINYQTKNNTTQPSNRNIHVKIRKLTQKKNLVNEPREVDVGLANPGNFTLTVLLWTVTGQRGRDVGLASTVRWTWKRMEEERLSESKVIRVGETVRVMAWGRRQLRLWGWIRVRMRAWGWEGRQAESERD